MTQWVDNFFGNDERDLEQAYSRLRLRTIYDWDDRLTTRSNRLGQSQPARAGHPRSVFHTERTWMDSMTAA